MNYDEVYELKNRLAEEYATRHAAFRKLRDFWFGRYWEDADDSGRSISSIFRDLTAGRSDTGPDVKLVYNVLQMVCVKYQAYLSPLPMIRAYTDPPQTERRRAQATKKERFLYGLWNAGKMSQVLNRVAWYEALMGDVFLGCYPDTDAKLSRPILRSPEYAFPVPAYDNLGEDAHIFSWTMRESSVAKQFPGYIPKTNRKSGFLRLPLTRRGNDPDPQVEIIEYTDDREFSRWVDGQRVTGVQHDYGFNIFQHLKFIDVPNEPWGHGAVEQIAGMNEMTNALMSLVWEAMIQNVFPRLVLINPAKAPELIENGPGAVIPINEGGNVAWLHPPVEVVGQQTNFLTQAEQSMRLGSGMPGVNFGESPASSIVTGKAVNELQGAGTGSTVEMVQGQLGLGLASWNQMALFFQQQMWPDDTVNLYGQECNSTVLQPRRFALSMKGKELVGSGNNDVVFMPHLNEHEKLVMGLQALGGGLVSKSYVREQIGIADGDAMEEDILREKLQDLVLTGIESQMQQDPSAENAANLEQQGIAYLTQEPVAGAPHPLLALGASATSAPAGAPPGGPPTPGGAPSPYGPIAPGAPGEQMAPALRMPEGSPMPGSAPQPAPAGGNTVSLPQAVAAFQAVQGLKGRVFLVGEIVQAGQTTGEVEVAVTNPDDRAPLTAGVPFKLVFHVVPDEPSEPHVEVTPGSDATPGGSLDQAAALVHAS